MTTKKAVKKLRVFGAAFALATSLSLTACSNPAEINLTNIELSNDEDLSSQLEELLNTDMSEDLKAFYDENGESLIDLANYLKNGELEEEVLLRKTSNLDTIALKAIKIKLQEADEFSNCSTDDMKFVYNDDGKYVLTANGNVYNLDSKLGKMVGEVSNLQTQESNATQSYVDTKELADKSGEVLSDLFEVSKKDFNVKEHIFGDDTIKSK